MHPEIAGAEHRPSVVEADVIAALRQRDIATLPPDVIAALNAAPIEALDKYGMAALAAAPGVGGYHLFDAVQKSIAARAEQATPGSSEHQQLTAVHNSLAINRSFRERAG